ncbi:enoyl-CoA hydratase-related protein [Aminobacter sp. LjRoot7]|uniref:enoyl-CoA hydratase-related protein n=1 Tax=Aminobacter sp. LjRoot7 TaxID=3342335 RepID=UPI003ECDCACE
MSGPHIRLDVERDIAVVTMARPPVNAFTPGMYEEIRKTFHAIADDRSIRVAILAAEGRTFCAGNDISGFLEQTFDQSEAELALIRVAFNALQDCPVPVIAAVNGAAMGTGIVLSALCDIRITSEKAFFALPEIAVGAMGGARHVMRMAPQGITRLMAFTGCRLSAEEALRVGMVERVVPPEALMTTAMEIAEQIAARSPNAIRLAKQAANRVEMMHLKEAYEYECTLISSLRKSDESREAALAFIEKRTPSFAVGR